MIITICKEPKPTDFNYSQGSNYFIYSKMPLSCSVHVMWGKIFSFPLKCIVIGDKDARN